MTNREIYTNIFKELFGVKADSLNAAFTFADTEAWDSMTHMTLISKLEEAFDVFFETEDILNFGSFLHGMEILRRYGVEI